MKFFRFAAFCILAPAVTTATTLVALWSPERIVLGADSRVVAGSLSGDDACKIERAGDTWVAMSGLVYDLQSGYRLSPLTKKVLAGRGPLKAMLARFAFEVQEPLQRAVDAMRETEPEEFARLAPGQPVLQAIFATHENGRPVLATIGFVPGADGALESRASVVDGSDARGPRLIYAGQQQHIRAYLRENRNWIEDDQHALVRNLIQLEIDSGAGLVGGPVDLVEIEASGPRWIQRKSACAE